MKILIIATYFPPAAGVCTFRVSKFVKFLPALGWNVEVLTVNEEDYKRAYVAIDRSLVRDVGNRTKLTRTRTLASKRFLPIVFDSLPIWWIPFLLYRSFNICINNRPAIVFATGDPFYPLIACPFLKIIFNIPYVVDLRDPWKLAPNPHQKWSLKRVITKILDWLLEPLVLLNASGVTVVSESMKSDYINEYPSLSKIIHVIPNGYDPTDFNDKPLVSLHPLSITYAGKLLNGVNYRDPEPFLYALRILIDEGLDVCFNYIGENNSQLNHIISKYKLESSVQLLGPMTYNDTISHLKSSRILLLIGNGQATEQTGKIFDYIGCQRPILALANQNTSIAEIANSLKGSRCIANRDEYIIANTVRMMLNDDDTLKVEHNEFTRKSLTNKLDQILSSIINSANVLSSK